MGASRVFQATVAVVVPLFVLVGCSSMPGGLAPSLMAGQSANAATLEGFRIKSAAMARDGGSIFVFGELADATAVSLKLDNGISSTTRGALLIQLKPPSDTTAMAMRRVTESEAAMLAPILEQASNQSTDNVNRAYLQSVLEALRNVEDQPPS